MTDKNKTYEVIRKGVCSHTQVDNLVAVKQFLIVKENDEKYLLVKLVNNRAQNVTGATLFVEQYDESGDKISAESVRVAGFDGYPQKPFAVEQKILVAKTCADCRVTVLEAEFGKCVYAAADTLQRPAYKFETESERRIKVQAATLKKAGKKGVTVQPRSLKMPLLIFCISMFVLIAAFIATWVYTGNFVADEDKFLHNGVYYSFVGGDRSDGSNIYVSGVRSTRSDIFVPAEIEGHKVISVKSEAFRGNTAIKKVSFGGDIVIDTRAFYGCTSLQTIDISNALYISQEAFYGCTSLRAVTLEKALGIGKSAFGRCTSLTSLKISGDAKEIAIGSGAFSGCSRLRTIDISRTITYDGVDNLFANCFNVTSLHLKEFDAGSRRITALFGNATPVLQSIIIDSIDTIGSGLCAGLTSLTTVRFNAIGNPTIGSRAFYGCTNLTEVVIPAAVRIIGDEAFFGTAINSFDGSALEHLGNRAFANCTKLSSFTLNKNTQIGYFGNEVFMNCQNLSAITMPDAVTSIELRAFYGCSALSAAVLPTGLTFIGEEAFAKSGLTEATIPENVWSIGRGAFYDCKSLQSLTVPFVGGTRSGWQYLSHIFGASSSYYGGSLVPESLSSVTVTSSNIAAFGAFDGCGGITNITYSSGLTSVGENAFRNCAKLTEIAFADGLASIGRNAFNGCAALTAITLPDTVTNVGSNAFGGCTALQTLTVPFVGESRTNNGFLAYMFGGTSYHDANLVPTSLDRVELTDTETIDAGAFFGASISEVVLGDTTKAIGDAAFSGNKKLNIIELPAGLNYIGTQAFYGCYFLYEIYNYSALGLIAGNSDYGYVAYYALKVHSMDESRLNVVSYNGYEFVNNESKWYLIDYPQDQTDLVLPIVSSETCGFSQYAVYNRLFMDNTAIVTADIPSNVTAIGVEAFHGCTGLKSVIVGRGTTAIGSGAFYDCTSLAAFEFPSAVTAIADDVLRGCDALKQVILPPAVTSIGSYAFNGCRLLTRVNVPDNCTTIGEYAFGDCVMLYSVNIPSSCQTIGRGAFNNCRRIKSVTLPASINSPSNIGEDAFLGCTKLYEVYNLTRFTVSRGSINCGRVAYYANAVHTDLSATPIDSIKIDELHYYKLSGTWNLVDYYGTDGDIHIGGFWFGAEYVNNIVIGNYAFAEYADIKSITMYSQVSRIGEYAFSDCTALAQLTVTANNLSIGISAFANCGNLTSLSVLSGNVVFESNSFAACGLTSVSLSGGTFEIKGNTFYNNANLQTLTASCASLSIYGGAFTNGLNSANINCSDKFTAYSGAFDASTIAELNVVAKSAVMYDRSLYYRDISKIAITGSEYVTINTGAIAGCANLQSLQITGKTINLNNYAFSSCNDSDAAGGVAVFAITGTQTNVYGGAFSNCIIKNLTISGGSISLSDNAFANSTIDTLRIVCSADSLTVGAILSGTTVSTLDIDGKAVTVSSNAFYSTGGFTALAVASQTLTIGNYAFYNQSSLATITLSATDSATIGTSAFEMCGKLGKLVLPSTLSVIPNKAFYDCSSLTELDIPVGVTQIGDYAFNNCTKLNKLTLPNGLTGIANGAFQNCKGLRSLAIPNTVTSIGSSAFSGCVNLESLTLSERMTEVANYAFNNCSKLTELVLPSNVVRVGQSAFSGCSSLTALTLSSNLTLIDNYAFYLCSALTSIDDRTVTALSIGNSAFYGCGSLLTLNLKNVADIGEWAFAYPYGLKKISLNFKRSASSSSGRVASYAFNNCNAVEAIGITADSDITVSVETNAFYGCIELLSLNLPATLKSISSYAFASCGKLNYIELPASLSKIEGGAFNGASSLFAVCNKSGYLTVEAGKDTNGGVAKYALIVTADPSRVQLTYASDGANKFVRFDNVWYLYAGSISSGTGYGLPQSASTTEGEITSYVIKSYAFNIYYRSLVVPKSVKGIQTNGFWNGVGLLYYRGTAEEWRNVASSITYSSIYYYTDCVHDNGEWTEIGGAISTVNNMSGWKTVKEPNCTEKGSSERRCGKCGETESREIAINPDAHEYDKDGNCIRCKAPAPAKTKSTDNSDEEYTAND